MRFPGFRSNVIPLLALLILFAPAVPARADLSLGFSNGLTGWTTAGDSGTVTASGGQATIAESTFASETDLFLNFTVPTGAQSLQFTLNSVFADSTLAANNANGYLPDSFGASLLNPTTLASLVPTVDPTTDSFYTRDVVDGVTQGLAANGVTVSSLPGSLALISVDLSSLNLDGQTAEILFRLTGGTDPSSSSTVTLSDVNVLTQSTVTVPEPNSFILAVLGIVSWIGYRRFHMRPAA
jgi:hypothetical protein